MNKEEVLRFIKECPLCNLATSDEDTPHVRGILPYRIDESGIIVAAIPIGDVPVRKQELQNKCARKPRKQASTEAGPASNVNAVRDTGQAHEYIMSGDSRYFTDGSSEVVVREML